MRYIKSYFSFLLIVALILFFFSCEKEEPVEKIFLNIEIKKLPEKTTFQLGEIPDFTGLEIVEVFTDGTKKTNTNFDVSWSADIFKTDTTQATVTARGRKVTFDISFSGDLIDTGLPVVYIDTDNKAPIDSKEFLTRRRKCVSFM